MSCYITTHNAEGKAVFSKTVPKEMTVIDKGHIKLEYVWTSHEFPADLSTDEDITQFKQHRLTGPHETSTLPPNGFATAIVTIIPGAVLPWHRVMSIDVFYIIEGDLELILDSGERCVVHAGDTFVQRATMHTANNITPNNGVVKMVGSAIPCITPVQIGNHELGEEWVAPKDNGVNGTDEANGIQAS